ncbi:hypothetical protein, partial [Propionivibrio sp.]|uniref:hypothetical protein n=1 Tax=Propionivibrio sp. TaxID=2212460 RepID=UPI0025F37093
METAVERDHRNTKFGEGLALTPTLSRRARGFAPFSLRANLCTHFALNLLVNDTRRIGMDGVHELERAETYDVGDFGDVRLKKT